MLGQVTLCDFCPAEYQQIARDVCVVCTRDCCSDHGALRLFAFGQSTAMAFHVLPGNTVIPGAATWPELQLQQYVCHACTAGITLGHWSHQQARAISVLEAAFAEFVRGWRALLAESALEK